MASSVGRYESALTYRWNVDDFAHEEPIRPEFYRHPATRHDRRGFYTRGAGFMPLGDTYSPYFPAAQRRSRLARGFGITGLMMAVVTIGTLGIYAIRLSVAQGNSLSGGGLVVLGYPIAAKQVASIVASTLNTVFITVFNAIYKVLAVKLVEWQNHRYASEHEDAIVQLNFLFQFVNSYVSFFYIAFWKPFRPNLLGASTDSPGDGTLKLYDVCQGDCMNDLAVQMLVVVISKQFLRNFLSALGPCLKSCYRKCTGRRRGGTRVDELTGAAKLEYEALLEPPRAMYFEYNEMAIQFGYVTMFAAAAPWATTLCMLNNLVERKADAYRMLYGHRRPPYAGASSIGAWSLIFEILSYTAIVTNVFVIGVTSQSLWGFYSLSTRQTLVLCALLEHGLLLLKFYVSAKVDSTPLWVRKSQAYMTWLAQSGEQQQESYHRDAEALQAELDEESDLERFWL